MSTQTIVQNKTILIKKKKTKSTKGHVAFRGLLLPHIRIHFMARIGFNWHITSSIIFISLINHY